MALTTTDLSPEIVEHLAGDIAATRAPISRARHAPGYIYTSPEIYALEKEKIFMRDWLCIARVEELEKPGDFMTFDVMDEPIIIARARDGSINAFRNSCAHRGLVVAKGSGNAKTFSCAYHGWSYDLTGQLVGAPFMEDVQEFDLSRCRLPALNCDVWAGWIFVNCDVEAPPLADHIAAFDAEFGEFAMGGCRTGVKQAWDLACNWKIMDENNHDLYHIQATHANTFGAGITNEEMGFNLHEDGRFSAFYHDPPLLPGGKTQFGAMPWLKDKPYDFACLGHLPPNLVIVGRVDSVVAVTSWPVSVNETRLLAYQLFAAEVFDRPNIDDELNVHDDFLRVILDEDTGIVVDTHKAVAQESYVPGPFSRLEASIYHCLAQYLDKVFGPVETGLADRTA